MNLASKDGKGKIFLSSFFFVLVATRKTSGKRYREIWNGIILSCNFFAVRQISERKRNRKEAEEEETKTKDKGDVGAVVRLIQFDRRFFPITFPVWCVRE